jgi:hypothetical protein
MAGNLRLARPYLVLLALFTLGRWLLGTFHVPYEKGHHVFSLVILTLNASFFYGAFSRRWRRFRLWQAAGLAMTLGFTAQVVVFAATLLSYGLGLHTYFNHPVAVLGQGTQVTEVPLAQAVLSRMGGLVANTILAGIAGCLGWVIGGLLPED